MEYRLSTYLTDLFERKKKKNSSYSKRSFARDLGLSSGRLSDILNQDISMSEKSVDKILERINCNEYEREKIKEVEGLKRNRQIAFEPIHFDELDPRVNIHHMALLTCLSYKPKKLMDLELELSVEAHKLKQTAYDLLELGLVALTELSDGTYIQLKDTKYGKLFLNSKSDRDNLIKSAHELAISGLETIPDSEQIQSCSMLQVSPEDIPLLKKEFKKIRSNILFEQEHNSERQKKVYSLTLSLTPYHSPIE